MRSTARRPWSQVSAIVGYMPDARTRGEIMRSIRRLIAADNMTQKENAKVEAQLAIARAYDASRLF
ncbi:hypothetical protein ACN2CC_03295 [Mesorhizobium muleiense]|uniref:hypothetical protein n=1 Tax=Mesorhizobium muleiense TaxID=1004279 RepID=UPI003AFB182A